MVGDPKDDPEHVPVEKRLSGDFASPLELLADQALGQREKRDILRVWLKDLENQPASAERSSVRDSVREALASLDREAR